MKPLTFKHYAIDGFTLVEMAMVLFIVAMLLGGLLPTISGQVEQQRINETRKQLDEIKEALIGYAIINGRLPCPASATSNGMESFASASDNASTGKCSNFYNGFLPASTLGLSGTDSLGFVIDPWGNRIRYAVTLWNNYVFTTTNGMSTTGISGLSPNWEAYLQVCSTQTGISSSTCAAGASITSSPGVPIVIFSTGKNGGAGGTGLDEAANLNNNKTFVSHPFTPATATNGEFDDIVVWISPNVLINRMVVAGRLP